MTSNEPFVDSHTLFMALTAPEQRTSVLIEFVCNSSQFAEIKANAMVLDKLMDFLNADIAFKKSIADYEREPRIVRMNPWNKRHIEYKECHGKLLVTAAVAHGELEMIRKLALPNNSLLMFQRPVLKHPR
jgi:hypothetical protein